jgi:hypothetical protein
MFIYLFILSRLTSFSRCGYVEECMFVCMFVFFFVFLRLPLVLLPVSLDFFSFFFFLILYCQSLLVVFAFLDFNVVTSRARTPRRSIAYREGRRISFVGLLFLGLLFVVDVFVVYLSLRDGGR